MSRTKLQDAVEKFWQTWMPCDWPPIQPDVATERRFKRQLRNIVKLAEKSTASPTSNA